VLEIPIIILKCIFMIALLAPVAILVFIFAAIDNLKGNGKGTK